MSADDTAYLETIGGDPRETLSRILLLRLAVVERALCLLDQTDHIAHSENSRRQPRRIISLERV